MKGSGETLSAGRAAAPGSRVGAEWRGRSDDRVAHVLAERAKPGGSCGHGEAARASARARPFQAMARAVFAAIAVVGLFVGSAAADIIAKPGDSGTIEYEFKNISTGPNERGEQVQIVPVVPPEGAGIVTFGAVTIKEDANLVPPITIEPGVTRTFVFPYQIAGTASDASFSVTLDVQMLNELTDPAPSSLDTSVLLIVDKTPPIIRAIEAVNIGSGKDPFVALG